MEPGVEHPSLPSSAALGHAHMYRKASIHKAKNDYAHTQTKLSRMHKPGTNTHIHSVMQ